MKATLLGFVLLWSLCQIQAQTSSPNLRLSGIINLPDAKLAIVEDASKPSKLLGLWIWEEGNSKSNVELNKILPAEGAVLMNVEGTPLTLALDKQTNQAISTISGFTIRSASLNPLLDLYGKFSGRTMLRSPNLPNATFTLDATATNVQDAARVLVSAFADKGISVLADGDKFALVVPSYQASSVHPHPPSVSSPASTKSAEPGGVVNWFGVDINQVLAMYADWRGLKFDNSQPLPPIARIPVTLRSQTPLSKEEMIYALDTLLRLRGCKVVPTSEGFAELAPLSEADR